MADVNVSVADARRTLAAAPNFTTGQVLMTTADVYYIPNDGRVLLVLQAATTANVTIETPVTVDGLAVTDQVLALGNTNVRVVGPFPPNVYNDAQGRLRVTTSANCALLAVRGA